MGQRNFSEWAIHMWKMKRPLEFFGYGHTQLLMVKKLTPPSSVYPRRPLSKVVENKLGNLHGLGIPLGKRVDFC